MNTNEKKWAGILRADHEILVRLVLVRGVLMNTSRVTREDDKSKSEAGTTPRSAPRRAGASVVARD